MKLNLKGLTQAEKERAKRSAGDIIVREINETLDRHESPVSGGRFKEKKQDGSLSSLFEFGTMRSQITFEELESDHIDVGIFSNAPTVEKLKSYNHNTGDTVPKRQFIAPPNRRFNEDIMDKVNEEISEIKEDSKARKAIEDEVVETILTPQSLVDLLDG